MNRTKATSYIAIFLAMALSNVALATPTNQEVASWYGPYGWEWNKIPAGTKIRVLIKFDIPTYFYREPIDSTRVGPLPEGQLGEFMGKTKDGWVQIHTKQGTGWVDYRSIEPAIPTK
jgi:hypothetical protein